MSDFSFWLNILIVFAALGMVIFVHELGHFLAAKACGVKCHKFYLGFNFFGWSLFKFKWGETIYGIGAFPLGGYVQMLGQEDNPARLRQMLDEAKRKREAPGLEAGSTLPDEAGYAGNTSAATSLDDESLKDLSPELAEAYETLYSPRSYLTKSVPQRLLIISAGVVMNIVFAFICATIAFSIGVERRDASIGGALPDSPLYAANVAMGTKVTKINDEKIPNFQTLQEVVIFSDDEPLKIACEIPAAKPGSAAKQRIIELDADRTGPFPRIGMLRNSTAQVRTLEEFRIPFSPAYDCKESLRLGDTIRKMDGVPVHSYPDVLRHFVQNPRTDIELELEAMKKDKDGNVVMRKCVIKPQPVKRLGLVMKMGNVTSIRGRSEEDKASCPGFAAGIKENDNISGIDSKPISEFDPVEIADYFANKAAVKAEVVLKVKRRESGEGDEKEKEIRFTPMMPDRLSLSLELDDPIAFPPAGFACEVLNVVARVIPGSPAEKAGLKKGDLIRAIKETPPEWLTNTEELSPEEIRELKHWVPKERTIAFWEDEKDIPSWPVFFRRVMQNAYPGTKFTITYMRDLKEMTAVMETTTALELNKKSLAAGKGKVTEFEYLPSTRGIQFEPSYFIQQATSVGDAITLGYKETLRASLLVYGFLRKLVNQEISPKNLGGPVTIFVVAKRQAESSIPKLLLFLCIFSANLAVINFLPIPILDGGHAVMLLWEGITRKAPSEIVQIVLTFAGLFFIVSLMLWVIGLDIYRFFIQ